MRQMKDQWSTVYNALSKRVEISTRLLTRSIEGMSEIAVLVPTIVLGVVTIISHENVAKNHACMVAEAAMDI